MLASLLRPKKGRRPDRSPFSSPFAGDASSPLFARRHSVEERRRPAARYNDGDSTDDEPDPEVHDVTFEEDEPEEDGDETTPLLPIFSAAHLDSLPVYNLTHTFRLLIVPRCETTLSWDQLRSPQVSQFLVKPIQQEIRVSHFSRATLYALLANCLQFDKEAYLNPGNRGTSRTRALVCELLAIKLLKEFTTRELVRSPHHALSYDFYPLQGLSPPPTGATTPGPNWDMPARRRPQPRAARTSTLEIAIRAQAKRFLAHPLVVQHLEAIWAGTIVFHSAADSLHRAPTKLVPNHTRGYGSTTPRDVTLQATLQASPDKLQPAKQRAHQDYYPVNIRRTVTIYDPSDASLFKLSRLRVPRYRQFLSTVSFAVLLALYVAVLTERSLDITALEVIFWFWSAGFMLDEIVGFNEQGFSLYIMSFWNLFDLGILLLLIVYYGLRLYGILMSDDSKHQCADMAYDVLASNAVLLFPRLFSVLDHYRYFSQLLIAFRLMAVDLIAVFVLIMISCSGFFVAFTLSFGNDEYDGRAVAYVLFQILLGFTPAAWNIWDDYNFLGKTILTIFLFVCHFLVVTILITVLTNSFMAIVANANEEHQFLFAVNAISMVKSDALFSYIAPANVVAWLLTPLRYVVSFRQFVRLNRTVIKVTHFPILFAIYVYERVILRAIAFEPTDLIEDRGRSRDVPLPTDLTNGGVGLFSPRIKLRQGSRAGFQQDRALDEVFLRPFNGTRTGRSTQKGQGRRKTSNVVSSWMRGMGSEGKASPPVEQDRSILDRLETRKSTLRRPPQGRARVRSRARDFTEATRSVASDPADFTSIVESREPEHQYRDFDLRGLSMDEVREQPSAEGDDELMTSDDDDEVLTLDRKAEGSGARDIGEHQEDYFGVKIPAPAAAKASLLSNSLASAPRTRFQLSSGAQVSAKDSPSDDVQRHHARKVSSATILYNPVVAAEESSASPPKRLSTGNKSARTSGRTTPKSAGRKSPRRSLMPLTKARPIMPPRSQFQSAPNLAGMMMMDNPRLRPQPSSLVMDLASDLGDNLPVQGNNLMGGVPSSFATQMAFATGAVRAGNGGGDESRMMNRLMLARMKTLEESFRDVVKEVRDMRGDRKVRESDERRPKKGKQVVRNEDDEQPEEGDDGIVIGKS
ncbi:MAG: hypothetical protein M1833_005651 [Piccolia ochrophora]|nr:MAG: hypothetical protein M1833_005651 [Piccolia ochrophora]